MFISARTICAVALRNENMRVLISVISLPLALNAPQGSRDVIVSTACRSAPSPLLYDFATDCFADGACDTTVMLTTSGVRFSGFRLSIVPCFRFIVYLAMFVLVRVEGLRRTVCYLRSEASRGKGRTTRTSRCSGVGGVLRSRLKTLTHKRNSRCLRSHIWPGWVVSAVAPANHASREGGGATV